MTKGNEEGRYIGGRTDEPLSEIGKSKLFERIETYKNLVKDDDFALFSSPMLRCIGTCAVLFPDKEIIQVPDLKEIDFGLFENHNYYELNGREDYQKWIDSGGKSDYPEGERLSDFIKRNLFGFSQVLKTIEKSNTNSDANGVIVCHGGTIMAIMSQITGKEYFDFQVKNGEGYLLTVEKEDEQVNVLSYCRV